MQTPRQVYDLVIQNGRVIDPESGLDAVRSLGIRDGKIAAVSRRVLQGREVIDARGLVVAPGFIDLHAMVRTTRTIGSSPWMVSPPRWSWRSAPAISRPSMPSAGQVALNYGASMGHVSARMAVMQDGGLDRAPCFHSIQRDTTPRLMPSSRHTKQIENGLAAGALGVGMGLEYTPAATHEVLETFRAAARYRAPVFVHSRATGIAEPGSSIESYLEVIGASAITGAPVHIVHLNSTSLPRRHGRSPWSRKRGIAVST